ncbi:hypothetical protein COY28_00210 [Candidatus Woesearchaeota archaeon CG_4_10_14_0_2_um_filter_57_5]|nr:MAG: hypothetical protein AUJ68_02335 [Candidatus Woesearchaeota archaeon CG1_02_57_44]PIN70921.1 MAG: hypothetical protein COV94_00555 [Candidatus Woesearchaeota archaeon CG11_big_fil_rev_8_21_14_0_20_57_5]PIZ57357.1 MAG: hypothetical protein COY28_00210 [Candidatus Woesearchaeota archaeon CG_4_10_14_0_2_um_filter_57_5]
MSPHPDLDALLAQARDSAQHLADIDVNAFCQAFHNLLAGGGSVVLHDYPERKDERMASCRLTTGDTYLMFHYQAMDNGGAPGAIPLYRGSAADTRASDKVWLGDDCFYFERRVPVGSGALRVFEHLGVLG